jgi:hypothetical protein
VLLIAAVIFSRKRRATIIAARPAEQPPPPVDHVPDDDSKAADDSFGTLPTTLFGEGNSPPTAAAATPDPNYAAPVPHNPGYYELLSGRAPWLHGPITRAEAESRLRGGAPQTPEGRYLVREKPEDSTWVLSVFFKAAFHHKLIRRDPGTTFWHADGVNFGPLRGLGGLLEVMVKNAVGRPNVLQLLDACVAPDWTEPEEEVYEESIAPVLGTADDDPAYAASGDLVLDDRHYEASVSHSA